MAAMSDTLEISFLDHVTGNAAYSPASAVYLGLTTSSGGFADGNTGTEVVGNGYQRQAITFGAASTSSVANNAAVTFPRSTAQQGTVYGWGLFSAQSAGDLLYHGMFSSIRAVLVDESFYVASGAISLTPSGAMQGYAFQNWSNLTLRNVAWSMPTALYLAICLDNGTEPSWHDHASGTLDSLDSYNDKRKAGLVNGASETYGGYQRVKITFNSASNGTAAMATSTTRDAGRWDNSAARSTTWDSTNSRLTNWGKTVLRNWTDRVEFPIVPNNYDFVVGGATTSSGGVDYTPMSHVEVGGSLYTISNGYERHYGYAADYKIFDAETGGNLLFQGEFDPLVQVNDAWDVLRIPASDIALVAA